ncbi:MAG TPA: PRC-barrel domain-containing protein [Phycisphaerales bacterium]|nr:PRC-barrel domain-containing protein [Phycisphaerales bacterium]
MFSKKTAWVPAIIALAAGQAFAQTGQPMDHHKDRRDTMRTEDNVSAARLDFQLGSKIDGMSVKNASKEDLGTISDVVIDRGSGRVASLVLRSGTILGMGGKTILVPYRSFGWDEAEHALTLDASKDEVKNWPEWDKKAWENGTSENGMIRSSARDYYDPNSTPWPATARSSKTDIHGKIKTFTRRNIQGREELVMVVTPQNGTEEEVVLGPSWYTAGNNVIPFYRDAPVDVTVFHTTRNGQDVMVARSATINGKKYDYYDSQGRPMWSERTGENELTSPFVLNSDIKGKDVYCRGDKCGKVRDTVIECISGRVAFLSIDPDKAFLGIGDQNRMVPFTILSAVMSDGVYLDADKAMVTSAPTTPKDLATLGINSDYKRVYDAYGVRAPLFDRSWRR